MHSDSHSIASLNEVARRCREETERFFQRLVHDTRYCYELFRRALAQRDGEAFELLMLNYRSLMDSWVRRHPKFSQTGEDAELFANTAFERLWMAIPPANFGHFPDLRALLRYLQMCAHCSVADYVRSTQQTVSLEPADPDAPPRELPAPEAGLSAAEKSEIWKAVAVEMRTEKERIVLHCCYALDMKPSEIYQAYPTVFASVQDVYRTKQNVLERLRRNEALRRFLAPYA